MICCNKRINAQPTGRVGIAVIPLNPTRGSCILFPVGEWHMQTSREPIASIPRGVTQVHPAFATKLAYQSATTNEQRQRLHRWRSDLGFGQQQSRPSSSATTSLVPEATVSPRALRPSTRPVGCRCAQLLCTASLSLPTQNIASQATIICGSDSVNTTVISFLPPHPRPDNTESGSSPRLRPSHYCHSAWSFVLDTRSARTYTFLHY